MRTIASSHGLAVFACALAGCIFEPATEQDIAEAEAEVAVTSQALGNWAAVWDSNGALGIQAFGNSYAVFSTYVAGCGDAGRQVRVVTLPAGQELAVPLLPECSTITGAVSDSSIYVADSLRKKILKLQGTAPTWTWVELANTPGASIGTMHLSSTDVFWKDSVGIHRVPKTGGSVVTITTEAGSFKGVDDPFLYVVTTSGSNYSLRRFTIPAGHPPMTLRTQTVPIYSLSFDANNYYWSEGDIAEIQRLRKMSKATLAVSTIHSSEDVQYQAVHSTGSFLYWMETPPWWEGNPRFRRMNLSNNNHVSSTMPQTLFDRPVKVTTSGVYFIGGPDVPMADHAIWRGSL